MRDVFMVVQYLDARSAKRGLRKGAGERSKTIDRDQRECLFSLPLFADDTALVDEAKAKLHC